MKKILQIMYPLLAVAFFIQSPANASKVKECRICYDAPPQTHPTYNATKTKVTVKVSREYHFIHKNAPNSEPLYKEVSITKDCKKDPVQVKQDAEDEAQKELNKQIHEDFKKSCKCDQ